MLRTSLCVRAGSRPSRRRADNAGINTLRAIPWQFAWTQTRLILPSWLGIGEAISTAIQQVGRCAHTPAPAALWDQELTRGLHRALPWRTRGLTTHTWRGWRCVRACVQGYLPELRAMYRDWPFFAATVDLIEMILAKSDGRIASLYEDVLVTDPTEQALGKELRNKLQETIKVRALRVRAGSAFGWQGSWAGAQEDHQGARRPPLVRVSRRCLQRQRGRCGCVSLRSPGSPAAAPPPCVLPTPQAVLAVSGHKVLLEHNPTLRALIKMRNPYIDPINIMQVRALVVRAALSCPPCRA